MSSLRPPSIVQTIVNVIEPDHGTVADIACGSGGMFVQSSHFIEHTGQDTAKRVTFYGHEKTASTIKLAKMNLAVHGLEGQISEAAKQCRESISELVATIAKRWTKPPAGPLATLKKATTDMGELAESSRDMIKDLDLLFKLAVRVIDSAEKDAKAREHDAWETRTITKLEKEFDALRKTAVEPLRQTAYFHRQAHWLLSRFPAAKLVDVPGLVKLVDRKEIEAADWSLSPGRYVGVAPAEVDEDFDFEQTMHDIHVELADLNKEAVALATKIQGNFEEMGI